MGNARTIVGPCRDVPFGEVIRRAWQVSGMTQTQFAEELGVTQPRVAEIFRSASITESLLDRCLYALGVELEVRVVCDEPQTPLA